MLVGRLRFTSYVPVTYIQRILESDITYHFSFIDLFWIGAVSTCITEPIICHMLQSFLYFIRLKRWWMLLLHVHNILTSYFHTNNNMGTKLLNESEIRNRILLVINPWDVSKLQHFIIHMHEILFSMPLLKKIWLRTLLHQII